MNLPLKNFLVLKTLKTFYIEYYKVLVHYLIKSIKNYLGEQFEYTYNNDKYNIYILPDFLFFKTTNLTSGITDTVQEFNPKLLIFLPVQLKAITTNSSVILYYLIGETPKYTAEKNLIINGLKKTFISKLTFNYTGIFFNSFIKNANIILYAKIVFNRTLVFNIILEENECFCILNNYKYNLISLLY